MPKSSKAKSGPKIQISMKPQPPTQQKKSLKSRPSNSSFGKEIGTALGSLLGAGKLGGLLGGKATQIFGQGDYVTNATSQNSLMGGPPSFGALTSNARIRHREFIRDIRCSREFAYSILNLNPGLNTTFPWLSAVANNYEEYKIHGMIVYLNTTSGASVASANTALGLWGVVTQYDPTEPDFSTKQQCENYVGCQSAVPSQSLLHGVECKPRSNVLDRMYVRNGTVGAEDLKFYDWGKIQIFTQGSQTNDNVIGELWVSYDIEFYKPRLPTGGIVSFSDSYYFPAVPAGTGPWQVNISYPTRGNLGTFVNNTNIMNFPSSAPLGTYLVVCWVDCYETAPSNGQPPYANGWYGSIVEGPMLFSNGQQKNIAAPQTTVTQRYLMNVWTVQKKTTDSGTFTVNAGVLGSGRLNVNTVVTLLNAGLVSLSDKPSLTKLDLTELNKVRTLLDSVSADKIDLFAQFLKFNEAQEASKKIKEPTEEPILEIGSIKE